jgi:hypothetical protein
MSSFKKLVRVEVILLVSLMFVILLTPTIFTGSSDSTSTSEWRMFHRTLNHTGVYPKQQILYITKKI